MDELIERARRELEPPWDEVREARVLSRVLEAAPEQPARPQARYWLFGAAAAAALALGVVALAFWQQQRPAPAALEARERPDRSVLSLTDGSQAQLAQGAEVQALEQTATLVRLQQRAGEVRYQVTPNPRRQFVIEAGSVRVRVIGTVFSVELEPGAVSVAVERGKVAVESGERAVELTAGEHVRLSSRDAAGSEAAVPPPLAAAPAVASAAAPASGPPASEPPASGPPASAPNATKLMRDADAARARGDWATAEALLRRVVSEHASSPQAASATFALGRVQSARGSFAAAARTFEVLLRRPSSPLSEDALAEAANAWALAGSAERASALAERYLAAYPKGPHAERMRRLGKP